MQLSWIGVVILATGTFVSAAPSTLLNVTNLSKTTSNYAPQFSPHFPNLEKATEVVKSYNPSAKIDTSKTLSKRTLDLNKYPEPWSKPDVKHAEVKAAIKRIDWKKVPKISVRKTNSNGDIDFSGYDSDKDPDCWWSSSNCVKPKVKYLPQDIYTCPRKGEWGLTYDDGPFNIRSGHGKKAKEENQYAEPQLYNFLAKEGLKSNLFVSYL
jgi:hypothetical protein